VVVGYTGGKEENPTYDFILDATEAVWIEYDPQVVPFRELLKVWSKQHNPFIEQRKRQYRSAIWYQSEQQRREAMEHIEFLKTNARQGFGKSSAPPKIHTSVEPAAVFYRAEEYHQDYLRKHTGGTGYF